MTRMKLDWCAAPLGSRVAGMSAFKVMFLITVVYYVVSQILNLVMRSGQPCDPWENYDDAYREACAELTPTYVEVLAYIRGLINLLWVVFLLMVTCKTRAHIRHKYNIPEENCCCQGCGDCCCSFWCNSCTICQMARHTSDLRTYRDGCCTDNGLAAGTPDPVTV